MQPPEKPSRKHSGDKTPLVFKRSNRDGPALAAQHIKRIISHSVGRKNLGLAELISDWGAIMGPELASRTIPHTLSFPKGASSGATLKIACASADATDLHMQIPLILERIHRHLGHGAITRILLIHST